MDSASRTLRDLLEEIHREQAAAEADVVPPFVEEPAEKPPPPPKRILVVDDDLAILVFCRRILEDSGYAVEVAETGAEALLRVRRRRPDLVLLDLNLPGIDGFEVCSRLTGMDEADLRKRARSPQAAPVPAVRSPILFITSTTTPEAVRRAIEVGAAGYVAKPLSPDVLVHRVRKALEGSAPGSAPAVVDEMP